MIPVMPKASKNLHVPLPEPLWAALRGAARQAGRPATEIAREASSKERCASIMSTIAVPTSTDEPSMLPWTIVVAFGAAAGAPLAGVGRNSESPIGWSVTGSPTDFR